MLNMKSMLYESPIFGPVHSRRLGVSLGVNLLPAEAKVCSFDCIYCECGYNGAAHAAHPRFPSRGQVAAALRDRLADMQAHGPAPDVITFAGNGEPTLHPEFPAIVDDVAALRDEFFPAARISVLSNATQILRDEVFEALCRVDNNILKLDTVDFSYIKQVDRPVSAHYDVGEIVERMARFGTRCIVQTLFMNGVHEGQDVSNISDEFVNPWLEALRRIQPREVMIYTIDRATPSPLLAKATHQQLDSIAAKVRQLGIACQVSY